MSRFVEEQVKRIDNHVDQDQLATLSTDASHSETTPADDDQTSPRVSHLQLLVKQLSVANQTYLSLKSPKPLQYVLEKSDISGNTARNLSRSTQGSGDEPRATSEAFNARQRDLEWAVVSKAAAQAYGHVLDSFMQQIVPLNDEIDYWNDVLDSSRSMAIYSVQTSPLRFWDWSMDIYREVKSDRDVVANTWNDFYGLVRSVIRKRSLADVQSQVVAPLAIVRNSVRHKRASLERSKLQAASCIGFLLSNCFVTPSDVSVRSEPTSTESWRQNVSSSVSVMSQALDVAGRVHDSDETFQEAYSSSDHGSSDAGDSNEPGSILRELKSILKALPEQNSKNISLLQHNGRPSRLIRYWLPATALLLSSSTVFRIIFSRRAAILTWIQDLGATILDFWANWVLEPGKKLIGTIRHDEASEVSIMSKRSLEGDRASLERMVVDFAVDISPSGGTPSAAAIADIRAKITEGDLTPVLRAYEHDLKSPLWGSVRGNLIRALLIQIQKTKVDVEVAMGGIDSLLKSQELVFGFVGLTPGILVCIGAYRWLRGLFGSRSASHRGETKTQSRRVLRNIDRILTASLHAQQPKLSFEAFGLLICEAIVLRDHAARALPKAVLRDFLHDFDALIDLDAGIDTMARVADRLRWAYGEWL